MPLYEYICPVCKKEIEVLQRMNDPAPKCDDDGAGMERQLSLTKTRRGAGLYSVDFGSKPKLGEFK